MTTKLTMNITPDGAATAHKAKGLPKTGDPGAGTGTAAKLMPNDGALELAISGFGTGAKIAEVVFYNNKDETAAHQIGSWTRTGPTTGNASAGLQSAFSFSATDDEHVTLSDIESDGKEHDRWYKVKVTSGTSEWWMDPEVINKAGGRNTGGTSWGPNSP